MWALRNRGAFLGKSYDVSGMRCILMVCSFFLFLGRLKDDQYQYKNVESRSGLSGETSLVDLKKYTKYSIVVQAYNALGPGPTSTEVLALTLEDVPSASPQEIRCTATTSQSLQVSWNSVPEAQVHGHLKGRFPTAVAFI